MEGTEAAARRGRQLGAGPACQSFGVELSEDLPPEGTIPDSASLPG